MKEYANNIWDKLTPKGIRARDALQRLTYSFYIKDKLRIRLEGYSPERLWIADTAYTSREIEALVGKTERVFWHKTLFDWARATIIPEFTTIAFIYRWFGNSNPPLIPFKEFKNRSVLCAEYYCNNFEAYKKYLQGSAKCKFNYDELTFYGLSIGAKIPLDTSSSEDDRKTAIKLLGLIVGILLPRKNTFAKHVALARIQSEIKHIEQSGGSTDELKIIKTQIDLYRQANPLSIFHRLPVQAASHISKSVLILLMGGIIVVSTIAAVNSVIKTPVEGHAENLPFFGRTEPYEPHSPLAAVPSNLDSANYWFDRGESEDSDSLKIIYFTHAIRHKYDFDEAYFERANAKSELNFHDDAIIDYTSCIIIFPDAYKAFNNRGTEKFTFEDYESSIKDFTTAIQIRPDYAESYFNRGNAKVNLSRYTDAIEDYERGISFDSTNPKAFFLKGKVERHLKLYERAISDFNHALQLDSSYPDVHFWLGTTKVDSLLKVLEANPPKNRYEYHKGHELISEIKSHLLKAMATNESNSNILSTLSDIENSLNDAERSGKVYGAKK